MSVVLWPFVVLIGSLPFCWVAGVTNVWVISGVTAIAAIVMGFASVRLADKTEPVRAKAAAAVSLIAAEVSIFGVGARYSRR